MEYLKKLSNSYMLLFLLHCDPKIAIYFSTMAGKLKILVGNSILVPAISEIPLDETHRRHWNLLRKEHAAGVQLFVTKVILDELAAHIRNAAKTYDEFYKGQEQVYAEEMNVLYVQEILIRSFLCDRLSGRTRAFSEFLDDFVSIQSEEMERELLEWLRGCFGVELLDETSVDVDTAELNSLTERLKEYKASRQQAVNDARTTLLIYDLRKQNREFAESGIFGYQTWWLSKDTTTQRAVNECFLNGEKKSVYMRPDFLNNYIAMAPNVRQINRAFDKMFPTLVGVSVSHFVHPEIKKIVQDAVRDHSDKDPARIRGILGTMADQLKTHSGNLSGPELKHYLDDQLAKLE